eukprot:scaffold56498_cov75-Phaeocystis_antarctica.AAC.1
MVSQAATPCSPSPLSTHLLPPPPRATQPIRRGTRRTRGSSRCLPRSTSAPPLCGPKTSVPP